MNFFRFCKCFGVKSPVDYSKFTRKEMAFSSPPPSSFLVGRLTLYQTLYPNLPTSIAYRKFLSLLLLQRALHAATPLKCIKTQSQFIETGCKRGKNSPMSKITMRLGQAFDGSKGSIFVASLTGLRSSVNSQYWNLNSLCKAIMVAPKQTLSAVLQW